MTLMHKQECWVFGHSILLDLSSSALLEAIKNLFENTQIMKIGENVWVLMLIMYRDYGIMSRSFRSLLRIKRTTQQLSAEKVNPTRRMFDIAHLLKPTMNEINNDCNKLSLLNILDGNINVLDVLIEHITDIDVERHKLLDAEWLLKAKSLGCKTKEVL